MAGVEVNLESTNPDELIAQGLRAYAISYYSTASEALGRAAELLAQIHGDEDDKLGEVYLSYAKSLLELTREEMEPLGDAIPQGEEDSDSDDEAPAEQSESEEKPDDKKEDSADKSEDKTESQETPKDKKEEELVENPEGKDKKSEGKKEDKAEEKPEDLKKEPEGKVETKKEESEQKSEDKKDEVTEETDDQGKSDKKTEEDSLMNGHCEQNGTSDKEPASGTSQDDAQPGTSKEGGSSEDDGASQEPENYSDLQVAWEVLELAKKIFTKRGDKGKELLAECLIVLGEVSMESENFTDAVCDMTDGLKMQKEIYDETSRKIAETYYKLGISYLTMNKFEDAVKNFESSSETLKKRIKKLEESSDNAMEINEIKQLIDEIAEKITDAKAFKESTVAALMELNKKAIEEASSSSGTAKEATNINHLVKRKRKVDEYAEELEAKPAKKSS